MDICVNTSDSLYSLVVVAGSGPGLNLLFTNFLVSLRQSGFTYLSLVPKSFHAICMRYKIIFPLPTPAGSNCSLVSDGLLTQSNKLQPTMFALRVVACDGLRKSPSAQLLRSLPVCHHRILTKTQCSCLRHVVIISQQYITANSYYFS